MSSNQTTVQTKHWQLLANQAIHFLVHISLIRHIFAHNSANEHLYPLVSHCNGDESSLMINGKEMVRTNGVSKNDCL